MATSTFCVSVSVHVLSLNVELGMSMSSAVLKITALNSEQFRPDMLTCVLTTGTRVSASVRVTVVQLPHHTLHEPDGGSNALV